MPSGDPTAARAPTQSSTAAEDPGFPTRDHADGARHNHKALRINARHTQAERGLDAYMSPPEAVQALMALERLPEVIWEPAAGDGTGMVLPLRAAGHVAYATDIANYGFELDERIDYLEAQAPRVIEGIVTNPPFCLALPFIRKALIDVPISAWLLRTNFLEGIGRKPFFDAHPPARVWISSRRLPMMHRHGWSGPKASSNVSYAWFVWDAGAERTGQLGWFDWREHVR